MTVSTSPVFKTHRAQRPTHRSDLEALFPGLMADLAAGGVPVIRDFAEMRFAPGGHRLRLVRRPAQPFICQASRPYLEEQLRAGVARCRHRR